MQPYQRPRIHGDISSMTFFIGEYGVSRRPRKLFHITLKLAGLIRRSKVVDNLRVVEGKDVRIGVVFVQVVGQVHPHAVCLIGPVSVRFSVVVILREVLPGHGQTDASVGVLVQCIRTEIPNRFVRFTLRFNKFNGATNHDEDVDFTRVQVRLDVLTVAVVGP